MPTMEGHSTHLPPYPDGAQGALWTQVLETLTAMQQTMATRDDLKVLVQREIYDTNRAADLQRAADTSLRLTEIERTLNTLKDDMHRSQLHEATIIGQMQNTTTQQIGQAAQNSQSGLVTTRVEGYRTHIEVLQGRLTAMMWAVGVTITASIGVISYLIGHH